MKQEEANKFETPDQGYILGIDTSCDETSLALLGKETGLVLENLISSQIEIHSQYGGVIPELASRKHSENLAALFEELLTRSQISVTDIVGVAATHTPGLIGCLLVGTAFAKALAYRLNVPLYAIHHLEAHLFSPFINSKPEFPFLGLVVSGGHTAFYDVESFDGITLIGQSVDDAAGEAFDKTAKLMGLGYPGGPVIDKLAQQGNTQKFPFTIPKVKMGEQYLSFSGLKTAVHHYVQKISSLDEQVQKDLAASLQYTIVEILIQKTKSFLKKKNYKSFALSGGVAMNSLLRERVAEMENEIGISTHMAKPEYCTDNAAMIAYLAQHREPLAHPFDLETLPTQKIQARQIKRKGSNSP